MRRKFAYATVSLATVALAGCAQGPQYTSLGERYAEMGPAEEALEQAQAAEPQGNAFQNQLAEEYLGYAKFEYERMEDFTDTQFYADRVQLAASGTDVPPQTIGSRVLPPEHVPTLTVARERLVAALDAGASEMMPEETARAQGAFDCWMEQQEEDIQPEHIAACAEIFETNLVEIETALAEQDDEALVILQEGVTFSADVLFEFDEAELESPFIDELNEVVALMSQTPDTEVEVHGHTDAIGTEEYNQDLSERRAQSVYDYLVAQGADPEKITTRGFGESQPVATNETPAGRALNRRVEIMAAPDQ